MLKRNPLRGDAEVLEHQFVDRKTVAALEQALHELGRVRACPRRLPQS